MKPLTPNSARSEPIALLATSLPAAYIHDPSGSRDRPMRYALREAVLSLTTAAEKFHAGVSSECPAHEPEERWPIHPTIRHFFLDKH
jgi:hypothetical protein